MRTYDSVLRIVLLCCLLLTVGALTADAQPFRNRIDNRGKEFRIAFLQTNGAEDAPRLYIVVAAEKQTGGRITYLRSGQVQLIPTLQPGVATRIELDTTEVLLPDPARTPITRNTILVQFDEEAVVYGVNTQRWSSDAFLALPHDAVGTDHIVISYPNTLDPNPAAAYTQASDFPSQFAIIGMENGTQVTIEPTARLKSRTDANPFTISLNAGDVFFGQAVGKAGTDLTGSVIRSNRPVVVYGSHQRANIPFSEAVGRDHLIEQLPSLNRWVKRAIVTPHFQIPKTVADKNIFRVMAAYDNTSIYIDSVFYATISARQMVELPLDAAKLITANSPILVTQYHHSTVDERFVSQPNDSVGDPFMMLALAPEQFDTTYWFESIATRDFIYHYINIVVPTERVSSLRLDGNPVVAPFVRIPKTSYSFAQLRLPPGPHRITGRAPFGLYSYGYGVYNSYGYPGAFVFDTLFKDQKQPDLTWYDSCGGAAGVAFDDSSFDFGIESVRLLNGSSNVGLDIDPFQPGADSVHFRLPLIDPYQDGVAQMVVVDTAGLDRHYTFPVKGFTVSMNVGQTTPVMLDTLASLNGLEFCRRITLHNYGSFDQRIAALRFSTSAPDVRVEGEFPVDIPPGGSREFSVCFQHVGDTSFSFEILADNGCLRRPVAVLPVISGIDSQVPQLNPVFEPCETDRTVQLTESGVLNSGIQSIEFIDSSNVIATITPSLPSKLVDLQLRRRDPYQDMIYNIRVTDAVGNTSTFSDTIGGFTISVQQANSQQVGVRVDRPWNYENLVYGQKACDTFYLRNYGLLPLSLQRPRILGNLEYSIPPEQLPIVLMPGEVRPLEICVQPHDFGEQIDTLVLEFTCGNPTELVVLKTVVDPLLGTAGDRCGNAIRFDVGGFVKKNFLQAPMPNPVKADNAAIVFGLTGPQRVSLSIHDGRGSEMQRLLDTDPLPGGIVRIDASLDDLPAGMYYLRLRTEEGDVLTEKLVISR